MAQKLFKWTGDLIEPTSFDGDKAPQWYGTDDDGNSYGFLEEAHGKACKSSNDDFAATTASSAKTWVTTKSKDALAINRACVESIRAKYTQDEEFKALRTASTDTGKAVLADIEKIVGEHTKLKNALVGD